MFALAAEVNRANSFIRPLSTAQGSVQQPKGGHFPLEDVGPTAPAVLQSKRGSYEREAVHAQIVLHRLNRDCVAVPGLGQLLVRFDVGDSAPERTTVVGDGLSTRATVSP